MHDRKDAANAQAPRRGKRRWIRIVLVTAVLLLALAAAGLTLLIAQADMLIQAAAESIGSDACGTAVIIGKVRFSHADGELDIHDVVVGNPPGYETPDALRIGRIHIRYKPGSLFSKRIHVDRLLVQNVVVNHEQRANRNNIDEIMRSVQEFTSTDRDPEAKDRYLSIAYFQFKGAKLRLRGEEPDQQKDLILEPIELYNVGENGTLLETIQVLATAISTEIAAAAARSSKWFQKSQETWKKTIDGVTDGTGRLFRNLRDAFKQTPEKAPDPGTTTDPGPDRQPEETTP